MKTLRDRLYKPLLAVFALVSMLVAGSAHRNLAQERVRMKLTRLSPPENLPPILAFTTVALGGFRGLIANALWIRASEMQERGRYFEMVQLADWITKLQPHIATVWYHQAWNMAYNISIKFDDPRDRWRWVQRGIELLRDQAIKYNPDQTILYRELSWFFQHKMGQNLDDAHFHYKESWHTIMTEALGGKRPNYDELLNPQNDEQIKRVAHLRDVLKLEPSIMKVIDDTYGPLEWRLPETHAIYWAYRGLEFGTPKDRTTVRRSIFQSMQLAFHRGRIIENKIYKRFEFGPNLELIPNADAAYEKMIADDAEMRDNFKTGHKNFLKDAVYFLYTHNRQAQAASWFKKLNTQFPGAVDPKLTLDEFAVEQVTEQMGDISHDRTKAVLQGLWETAFYNLAIGEDDQAAGYDRLAQRAYIRFQESTAVSQGRVGLPPMDLLRRDVVDGLLAPDSGVGPELAAQLRTKLGLGAGEDTSAVKPIEEAIKQGRPTHHVPYKGSVTNASTNATPGVKPLKIISTPIPE